MARGLALPIGPDRTGRTRVVEGDAQANKVINLFLSDNDNENAFQQNIGLGQRFIFDPKTAGFRGKLLVRLFAGFAEYERLKLYKLIRESIEWENGLGGDTTLKFRYINLESDKVQFFSRTFGGDAQ